MTFIKSVWKKWLIVARAIGNFQAQVIFSIFYIVFLSMMGIIFRFFLDALKIKKLNSPKQSNFHKWVNKNETLIESRKQF